MSGADYRQQEENEHQQWEEAGRPDIREPQPFSDEWFSRMKTGHAQLEEVLEWASKK